MPGLTLLDRQFWLGRFWGGPVEMPFAQVIEVGRHQHHRPNVDDVIGIPKVGEHDAQGQQAPAQAQPQPNPPVVGLAKSGDDCHQGRPRKELVNVEAPVRVNMIMGVSMIVARVRPRLIRRERRVEQGEDQAMHEAEHGTGKAQ